MLLTLRGTPTMYYGDEIGMHDVEIPPGQEQDPVHRQGPGYGRDPERTPMQWDAGPNAGFCDADVAPWLPIAGDHDRVNVESELRDPTSMLSMTCRLLRMRRASPALTIGTYRPLDIDADCFVYLREHGDERRLIALNFSNEEAAIPLEQPGTIIFSSHDGREGERCTDMLSLHAYEGVILDLT
jgi:alpha-glucosidase